VGVLCTSMVWKSKSAVLHSVTAGADVFAPVHDVDNGFRVAQGIGADQSGSPLNIRLQPSATMAWAAAVETQTLGCDKRQDWLPIHYAWCPRRVACRGFDTASK
jgi:hypothetical protein